MAKYADPADLAPVYASEDDLAPPNAEQAQEPQQKPAAQPRMPPFLRYAGGLGEAGLQALTGTGSSIVGGLAALPDTVRAAFGMPYSMPGDIVRNTQERFTYSPRSPEGKVASDVLQFPGKAYNWATRKATNLIRGSDSGGGRDLAATWAEIGADALPVMLGGARMLEAEAARVPTPMTKTQETLAAGQKEGLVATPSELGRSSILQGASGKIRSQQRASAMNQETVNRIAERELAPPPNLRINPLPKGKPITSNNLAQLREDAYTAGYGPIKAQQAPLVEDARYARDVLDLSKDADRIRINFPNAKLSGAKEVADLANGLSDLAKGLPARRFSTEAAIEYIKQLRNEGHKALQWRPTYDATLEAVGHAKLKAANALENLIDRTLSAAGQPELVKNYRDARTLIAKTHTVEDALTDATGNVSARALASGKSAGALTGGLKIAADFSEAFRKSTQKPEVFGGTPPISPLDVSMATIAALGGSIASGNIGGMAAGAIPFMRPLATPYLFGPRAQASLLKNPLQPMSIPPSASSMFLSYPSLLSQEK